MDRFDLETGIIIDANRQAQKMLGLDREKIIGLHYSDLHPPQKRDFYVRLFQE